MRLFFALWPPPAAARALAQWARDVWRDAGGRATAEETIHLTLAFLGEADPAKAIAAGREARGTPFDLGIGAAKYWRHNRIVWVGPETLPPELKAFAGSLHGALAQGGFALEERPFAAHVSLVRKASPPGAMPPLPKVEWPVREFLLVRSVPGRTGARYEPVERFPLA